MLSAGRESAREPKPAYHYDIRVAAATARAAQTAVPNNCHSSGLARFGSVRFGPVRFGSVRFGWARLGQVEFSAACAPAARPTRAVVKRPLGVAAACCPRRLAARELHNGASKPQAANRSQSTGQQTSCAASGLPGGQVRHGGQMESSRLIRADTGGRAAGSCLAGA